MNLAEIETSVGSLTVAPGDEFIFALLAAYGHPRASITRLRKGSLNKATEAGDVLWAKKVYYRNVDGGCDPHVAIDDIGAMPEVAKHAPRFVIVTGGGRILAKDTKTGSSLDVPLERLALNAEFFMPWAGLEKAQLEAAHYADVKAAEKMARLYDEIWDGDDAKTNANRHALNVFFARLLFCFFAEDTAIFEPGQVTSAIASLTRADGEDLPAFLEELFITLDTPPSERGDLPSYLTAFGYVNGALFSERTPVPTLSAKARNIILECAELDWSEISPDIFGSMMQAVVHPHDRAGLGMHYTSVENIMRVLRPLFLDELLEDFAREVATGDPRRLHRLHDRVSKIRIFDPACGSGNFLVIAYKELRALEHLILERLRDLDADPRGVGLFEFSRISLDNFFGIEVDDFAGETARLSLWLAKHQVDKQFEALFGSRLQMLPLREGGNIVIGNAVYLDWADLVEPDQATELYIAGNPPYIGSKKQTAVQKRELRDGVGEAAFAPNLDYVSVWFIKGAHLVRQGARRLAFVTTSSVSQGDHVGLLFPHVLRDGVEIAFAHTPFEWGNLAKGGAGVTVSIVGLAKESKAPKRLISMDGTRSVEHIGPYLRPMRSDVYVTRRSRPISALPEMRLGSMPKDGGHLNMTRAERDALLDVAPEAGEFIRRYVGADEFARGIDRYCLWVRDEDAERAWAIPELAERFEKVREMRLAGSDHAAAVADRPYRFVQRAYKEEPCLIVPGVSTGRREYLPIGFLDSGTVVSNLANAVYGAEPWLFALVQSTAHMTWLRAVGGQLRTATRYSAVLVYNTFPVPPLSAEQKGRLSTAALGVLAAREHYPDLSVLELYDPAAMPPPLRAAHDDLDSTVDSIYAPSGFRSNDERLELLFALFAEMTSREAADA